MNRFLRKAMALALAGTMTMGMNATAFAADGRDEASNFTITRDNVAAVDTNSINLIKNYTVGSTTQASTQSPAESFIFNIVPYAVWNAGSTTGVAGGEKYDINNMPLLGTEETGKVIIDNANRKTTITIKAENGEAEKTTFLSQKVAIPAYNSVGDFWYKVTETDNNVAGVIYATNDVSTENKEYDNNGHQNTYYIHVQVTNGSTKGTYTRTVTLHKTAPALTTEEHATTNAEYESWYKNNNQNSTGEVDKKVNDIENKYYAGSLKITKNVTGNAGDKEKLFKVNVKFVNDSNASMNSDITYKNFYDEQGRYTDTAIVLNWKDSVTAGYAHSKKDFEISFYVKDGCTVIFDNIPYGVTYTVTEDRPENDNYTHSFEHLESTKNSEGKFNGIKTEADVVTQEGTETVSGEASANVKWNNAKATGSISDDSDTVTITNNKESVIDVGVITSNAPYVAVLILAAAALVLYVRRRKDMFEE